MAEPPGLKAVHLQRKQGAVRIKGPPFGLRPRWSPQFPSLREMSGWSSEFCPLFLGRVVKWVTAGEQPGC